MRALIFETTSRSEEETIRFGERLGSALRSRAIVGLTGPLGAGKTRLVQGIARGAGYGGRVRSPSFALLPVYRGRLPLRHFDLYRLDDVDDGTAGEWEEAMESEGISLVEWADRVPGLVPDDAIWIDLTATAERDRTIRLRVKMPTAAIGDWVLQ